jgi:hypothetical protein
MVTGLADDAAMMVFPTHMSEKLVSTVFTIKRMLSAESIYSSQVDLRADTLQQRFIKLVCASCILNLICAQSTCNKATKLPFHVYAAF